MRQEFWPDSTASEVDALIATTSDDRDDADGHVLVAERPDGGLCGFAELGSRKFAEGCATSPVGFLEGIWVDPDARRDEMGTELVCGAERWARARGFTELASDCEIGNIVSDAFHRSIGFNEAARIVCFHRDLSAEDNEQPN